MAIGEILQKHGYVRLTEKEAKQSKATHQHSSMHPDERYALTLTVDGINWSCRDHRGDESKKGTGADELDAYLSVLIDEDEG